MKISLIVAVYKDIEALKLIIKALENQTYKNFEVILAEDGEYPPMKEYISTIKTLQVKHTTQEDLGVRKARSQNNGILSSSGEYLIFIDGDCIPYTTFVEGHLSLSQKGIVLSGRRVNLNQELTRKVKNSELSTLDIEKNIFQYIHLIFDKEARYRQGIYLKPNSFIYKLLSLRQPSASILGCNFSCFKKDLMDINGFDESYGETAIPDDMDLDWRFRAYGLKLKSCKNVANMFHLWHKIHDRGDAKPYLEIMYDREKNNQFLCCCGLNTHE